MKLEELLPYDSIVIQCHDNPDADAIASGYGVYTYLKEQGKQVRLIYGGTFDIQKGNLLRMIKKYEIPIKHEKELEEPALLLTVDCQCKEQNVYPFSGKTYAVIDHHQISDPAALPAMQEIHSNYGSCATIIWQMLKEADYDIGQNRNLCTALYYGLYTDTNKLKGVSYPLDKDMLDDLDKKIDKSDIDLFQMSNISREELSIVSQALAEYTYDSEHLYAVAKAKPCDPNILGLISDMLIEADGIDTCIVHCMLKDNDVKTSVRSCIKEARADELCAFVSAGLGGGGGHLMKAGGRLKKDKVIEEYKKREKDLDKTTGEFRIDDAAHSILCSRMKEYFNEVEILDLASYQPDLSKMKIYRKKKVSIGYAPAKEIFPAGTKISIRMLEGEIEHTIEEETCLMMGVENEVYPCPVENFKNTYEVIEEPYDFQGEYSPVVRNTETGEVKELVKYIRSCTARGTSLIYAQKLDCRTKVFTGWDDQRYIMGEVGDWLVAQKERPEDVYIVKKHIFTKLYELYE